MTNTVMTHSVETVRPDEPQKPPVLEVRGVSKKYGDGPVIFQDLSLEVDRAEIVCLVGPSGVGKTTLLKSLAGLQAVTEGDIFVEGRVVKGPPRELALVFQDYSRSLMPWLTVESNVGFPLRRFKLDKSTHRKRIEAALGEVGLSGSSRMYPWQLSGGMQQRVAIARALAYEPEVLIMDEPFASVDAQTRFELEDLTRKIRSDLGMTIILVTHDIDEAVYLADKIFVLGNKPATVVDVVDVPLGESRDQVHTRSTKEYVTLRTRILEAIKAAGIRN